MPAEISGEVMVPQVMSVAQHSVKVVRWQMVGLGGCLAVLTLKLTQRISPFLTLVRAPNFG
ncbi:MAG TPA: hypothetical protein PKJ03_10860, partial [Methanoregulaceae archaeon]|nr:hypothetical protein [Methanoregulaceae archaeon]